MLAVRRLSVRRFLVMGWRTILRSSAWALVVYLAYVGLGLEWLAVPFLPLTTIGIAVSFYVGFKNNSAYERFWEGRKIWGAVVNESRSWANGVLAYVRPGDDDAEARELRRSLIYRHVAWINALRVQLRRKSRFFDNPAPATKRRLENHAEHMRNDWEKEIGPFLDRDEYEQISATINPATHLVKQQGQVLAREWREGALDKFHQIDLMAILRELYTLQGKCERIKNTPFPRQYAEFGGLFVQVFVGLVPFGLLDVFSDRLQHVQSATFAPTDLLWLVPYLGSAALIHYVFISMERIGDASEDPFERSFNDVPMNALCRTIERDLRQMLGEDEVPPGETAIDGILY
ncbi:MAG: bestrophin family ion channel [Myxococcota bacterium]